VILGTEPRTTTGATLPVPHLTFYSFFLRKGFTDTFARAGLELQILLPLPPE
jgi:hypothetical protein